MNSTILQIKWNYVMEKGDIEIQRVRDDNNVI
mgnify:CR=1 FL=1